MWSLKKYWKKYGLIFVVAIICVSFEAACDLIEPQIMSKLIDNGVVKMNMNYVISSGLLMLGITLVGAIFACSRNILSSKTSQSIGADICQDLFIKIQSLSVSKSDKFDGGSLITRLTNDITQLTNFINGTMRIIVKSPITFVGCVILCARLNPHTIPIITCIIIFSTLSMYLSIKTSYPVFYKVQSAIDKFNTTIREYLIGIRLVRAFGRYKYEEERFDESNKNLSDITTKANRILSIFSPITNITVNVGVVFILVLGANWVSKGEMTVGQIVAFTIYMAQILTSLSIISGILNIFVRTKASYIRIEEVMNIENTEDFSDYSKEEKVKFDNSSIRFKNISFRYPESTGDMAIKNLNFNINRGETLGIIGATGSGKSSLASLLLDFYKPTGGEIFFGDDNIRNIPSHILRNHIAIVPQKATLFSGTIRENICFGNREASDEEILKASNIAQADEFINSLKDKYETYLGQSGVNISGGQKQRISIARALVTKPDLLILDDCTSALDAITEAKVQSGLKKYSKDLSCILISQRISTVMRADNILVLDNGNQVGFGKHGDLLKNCSMYRDIVISQFGKEGS